MLLRQLAASCHDAAALRATRHLLPCRRFDSAAPFAAAFDEYAFFADAAERAQTRLFRYAIAISPIAA